MHKNKTDHLSIWKTKFDQIILAPWSPFKSTILDLKEILDEASAYVHTLNPSDKKQLKLAIEITTLATNCFDQTLNHFKTECSGETIMTPLPQNLEQSCLVFTNMQIAIVKILNIASFSKTLTKNEVEIDENNFTVTFNGHTCELGNTIGFKIFQYLHKNIGANVPVNDLKNAVWGQHIIEENTLQKTISSLRKTLKDNCIEITIQSNIKGHYSMTLNEVS